ncbi:hypothetical protein GQ457_16G016400 [Hibiscus cannabinus]
MLTIEPIIYKTMVKIFYSKARCIVDEAGIKTIGIESYLMGRTILLDVVTLANHLGLEDETTQISFVHARAPPCQF